MRLLTTELLRVVPPLYSREEEADPWAQDDPRSPLSQIPGSGLTSERKRATRPSFLRVHWRRGSLPRTGRLVLLRACLRGCCSGS